MTSYEEQLLKNLSEELNYLFQFYDNLARKEKISHDANIKYRAKADSFYLAYERLSLLLTTFYNNN